LDKIFIDVITCLKIIGCIYWSFIQFLSKVIRRTHDNSYKEYFILFVTHDNSYKEYFILFVTHVNSYKEYFILFVTHDNMKYKKI